jgi:hypothetical protein
MANAENKFDRYFRDKLVDHEEKPAGIIWEKLENRLNKEKSAGFSILKIAAAVLFFLGLGFTTWQIIKVNNPAPELITEAIENKVLDPQDNMQQQIAIQEEEKTQDGLDQEAINGSSGMEENPKEENIPKPTGPIKTEKAKVLLAQVETEKINERSSEILVDIPDLILPELNIEEAVASFEENESSEEFVEYRVIIKSNGLKDEPKKQNIIEGIENNVNKIGGLLSKVEQGFADLQDAKDNLFASNTPRKQRGK